MARPSLPKISPRSSEGVWQRVRLARVSGLISAEISVDPHLLQPILQSHINDLLTEPADRFDPAGLGGHRSPQP